LIRYRASWIVPISEPPFRDGWVAVDRGRVAALGRPGSPHPDVTADLDLGEVALMPGLVNAHTHLELSYLRGVVPPADDFVTWVRGLLRVRRPPGEAAAPEILDAIDRGIEESIASGSALVGDISNTLASVDRLGGSALAAVVFHELVRFREADPERFVEQARRSIERRAATDVVRIGLAPHAPYSVAPRIFEGLGRVLERQPLMRSSVHLAESAAEVRFLARGDGPWRTLLEDLGAFDPAWVAPGVGVVRYLDERGFLGGRVLAVHGVHLTDEDLARLAGLGVTLVTCPRSNQYTGAGTPPVERFYAAGVRVAVGTDSLTSAPDLSVFAELAELRRLTASVPARALLDSATRQGARGLGFEREFGTLEPGRRARLLAVRVPPGVVDVEEYLVSGIATDQLMWVGGRQVESDRAR
jgi:cytosine/adenosine deaminase-related metal-dependent hydrolase